MDKTFLRNYIIFISILVVCSIGLIIYLNDNNKRLGKIDDLLLNTQSILLEGEQLSFHVEGLIPAQRGYVLTANNEFLVEYRIKKQQARNNIKKLKKLLIGKTEQLTKVTIIEDKFVSLTKILEETIKSVSKNNIKTVIDNIEEVDDEKSRIIDLNSEILESQYSILNKSVKLLDRKRDQYFKTLIIGIIIGTILLVIFNSLLLISQRNRMSIQKSLSNTEERMKLALSGTQDGIYDWDIVNNKVFYSAQFFSMLGDDKGERIGSFEDFSKLMHPDDIEDTSHKIELFVKGELSEYNVIFRMKHADDRWVWVNSKASSVKDKNDKVIRVVGAHTDITYQKETEKRLEKEKDIALSANQAKGDFLAHMSHEIRTPLTAISGIGEILIKQQDKFNDKQKELVKTLNSSASSLKDLINDILDFSRIESGEIEIENKAFNIKDMIEEIISMMSVKAQEKELEFNVNVDDLKNNVFLGDKARIRQILVNLIGNSIKFTNKGSVKVEVSEIVKNNIPAIKFDIIDSGIGIAEEKVDLIFDRFKQADSSVSRTYGGTGLGLPISKKLAEMMLGNIEVTTKEKEGSTFSLIIPLKAQQNIVSNSNDNRIIDKVNDQIRSKMEGKNKVLLVEDYPANVLVIQYMLDEIGIEYDVAINGEEAIKLYFENYYDIVLMDVQMPKMDGFTATSKIRKFEEDNDLNSVPIIGMTAHALLGDKDKCIEAGMSSYLPKPIVEKDFKSELLKFINRNNSIQKDTV